jgi:RNA 2',3'-cyclic 3'-phosphodiesterase
MLRLFVAAYPPPEVANRLLDALPIALPEHKKVPADQVHITLAFLGERRPNALPDIEESVAASCRGVRPSILRVQRLMTLPENKGPARLIAAETDAPGPLYEIHQRLMKRLAIRDRKDTDFIPHLTLCRFSGPGADYTLSTPAHTIPALADLAFVIDAIHLVRSVLHPLGARHHRLRSFPVG